MSSPVVVFLLKSLGLFSQTASGRHRIFDLHHSLVASHVPRRASHLWPLRPSSPRTSPFRCFSMHGTLGLPCCAVSRQRRLPSPAPSPSGVCLRRGGRDREDRSVAGADPFRHGVLPRSASRKTKQEESRFFFFCVCEGIRSHGSMRGFCSESASGC